MKKVFSVAIIGCGSRGLDVYAFNMVETKGFEIVSVCDKRETRIERAKELYSINPDNCFLDENEFFKEKRADVLVIATQDRDHVRQCIKALEKGYDVLLEKPISPSKDECLALLAAHKKYGGKVIVCHVLRYAPAYKKAAELIDSGAIGKLIDINALEQVGYWHIAHSFVRGNWRNSEETSPMILAKCCHDMDLLQYFAKSKAKSVSSIGDLSYFKKENQPKDAADKCDECKYDKTCPYSAYRTYVERWKEAGMPDTMWPQNVVCLEHPLTEEKIINAYKHNKYGRCVFACDNNVVDHQTTNILFENGVTANLTMLGFTQTNSRIYRFHGSIGEIVLDEERKELVYKPFGGQSEIFPFSKILKTEVGHGGGDLALIEALYDSLTNQSGLSTVLESSIESHLMAFAAEASRLKDGKAINPHE
ncbi:MAG: Gfo/Idh/MocA family oxidoreductase [Bacilli bacterium]|nr:Gfo/Idh/MocA family oxidoreductase [Bacilli bacterium]